MTERALFFGALERTDPRERTAFLDGACVGDPALRARIEALLRASGAAGAFLDVPAVEQLAAHADRLPAGEGAESAQHGTDPPALRPDDSAGDPIDHETE